MGEYTKDLIAAAEAVLDAVSAYGADVAMLAPDEMLQDLEFREKHKAVGSTLQDLRAALLKANPKTGE